MIPFITHKVGPDRLTILSARFQRLKINRDDPKTFAVLAGSFDAIHQ